MYINVTNENVGWAVATYGDYVVVANPALTRYTPDTQSVFHTGSVDYFRYNKTTDQHDFIASINKSPVDVEVLLARELDRRGLKTESTGSVPTTANKGLLIDKGIYDYVGDDGFGLSLDLYQKLLVVGSPYYTRYVSTDVFTTTGSGATVELFNLENSEFTSLTSSTFIFSIDDPDYTIVNAESASFGYAVSINNEWLSIGSPFISSSAGMVYMYKNMSTGSNYSWSLYQKIDAPITSSRFGHSLRLNKVSGSYSSSMVIGCGNTAINEAYYYELVDGTWSLVYTFRPDSTEYPLTFANYMPYSSSTNNASGFGQSVSIYGDSVIVGEYLDRTLYEYSGSTQYQQGSVYIFEKCSNVSPTLFSQVFKSYGTSSILKNNRLGFSVDIFGSNAIAGIPKTNFMSMSSCYLGGTIEQLHQCESDSQNLLVGQAMLIQKDSVTNEWELTNVYQRKKKYLSPYRSFGFDVAIADRSMVVGAPMNIADTNREINISVTQSNNISLDDITGKAYIYNLKNLRDKFHVGNVFYRNGKVIMMTSGSEFNGLFYNPINVDTYEYDIKFDGQHTIFEKQVICTVNSGEFNVSTNPSALITTTSSFDINKNGKFDFQDLDVIMRYMQYKNTSILGVPISTDWSSSVVQLDDEKSVLLWNQNSIDNTNTSLLASESIIRWETTDTWMQNVLDFNEDNKIDVRDMSIMWKYFTNRLTQENYSTYIDPSCRRKLFSDIIDYLNNLSQKHSHPLINPLFFDYERSSILDKTGSFLSPMVTTVGLYEGLDLIGVAKLGTPIKITPEIPYNFIIRMDF